MCVAYTTNIHHKGVLVIKIYVRAIVPTGDSYVLMGDTDKDGGETWDLPGGELKAGVDVKDLLRQLVLENTGYSIVNMHFFEITCRVKPKKRGSDPMTVIDFVFTSKLEAAELLPAAKPIELLRYESFEWLESGGRFRENKVMALLAKYHQSALRRKLRNAEV